MTVMTDRLSAARADRYRIKREQGGMATVYLARDLRHDIRHDHQSICSAEVVWITGTRFVSLVTQPTSTSPIEIPIPIEFPVPQTEQLNDGYLTSVSAVGPF